MSISEKTIAFSGSIPHHYEQGLGPLFFEPFALDMVERVKNLNPRHLLEVACGTGRVTKHLAQTLAPGANILATDINPAMVNYAKDLLAAEKNIRWGVMDAVELSLEDDSLDCIVSQFGVMFYSDRVRAYEEAWRVLKPGGAFLFNAWDHRRHNPAAQFAHEVIEAFFPVDTPAFYQVPFSYYDESAIRGDLALAGFKNVRMEVLQLSGYSETAAAAAQGLLEGTPVYTAIVERDEMLLPRMEEVLGRKLAASFGEENLRVPLQARVVLAVKG